MNQADNGNLQLKNPSPPTLALGHLSMRENWTETKVQRKTRIKFLRFVPTSRNLKETFLKLSAQTSPPDEVPVYKITGTKLNYMTDARMTGQ